MSDIDNPLFKAFEVLGIQVGDIFEDCSFHPVLCLGADYKNDQLWGVSLVDGSQPRCCSLLRCGVRKLTPQEAWTIKMTGPLAEEDAARIAKERRWWNQSLRHEAGMRSVATVMPAKLSSGDQDFD
jgi:hypothetical protein